MQKSNTLHLQLKIKIKKFYFVLDPLYSLKEKVYLCCLRVHWEYLLVTIHRHMLESTHLEPTGHWFTEVLPAVLRRREAAALLKFTHHITRLCLGIRIKLVNGAIIPIQVLNFHLLSYNCCLFSDLKTSYIRKWFLVYQIKRWHQYTSHVY